MLKRIFAALAFLPVLAAPAGTRAQGSQTGNAAQFSFEAIDGGAMPRQAAAAW